MKCAKLCYLIVYLTVIGDNEYLKYNDIYPPSTIFFEKKYLHLFIMSLKINRI